MSKKRLREVRIDPARVQELINYDPDTGEFTWKVARRGCAKDSKAGNYDSIMLDRRGYTPATVAYICVLGVYPESHVFHVNGDQTDNRWQNLSLTSSDNTKVIEDRLVTYSNSPLRDLSHIDYLYEMYTPNFEDGTLIWNHRPCNHFKSYQTYLAWNKRYAGLPAGTKTHNYTSVAVGSKNTRIHRVIWAMYHRRTPSKHIDHIDGNPDNNSISNLREADRYQNLANRGKQKNNSTGYKGVCFDKSRGVYVATIGFKGKLLNLGRFKTAEEAYKVYCAKAQELNPEFYNLGDDE